MPVRDYWCCFPYRSAEDSKRQRASTRPKFNQGGFVRLPPTEMSTEQAWIYAFPLFSLNHRTVKIFS